MPGYTSYAIYFTTIYGEAICRPRVQERLRRVVGSLSGREHARHGYEIGKLIETRSQGALCFQVASLYPMLYRLESRGWIYGRWVEKAGQRRRRYYRLTSEGRKVLAAQRRVGGNSSKQFTSSPESTMPDWKSHSRAPRASEARSGIGSRGSGGTGAAPGTTALRNSGRMAFRTKKVDAAR